MFSYSFCEESFVLEFLVLFLIVVAGVIRHFFLTAIFPILFSKIKKFKKIFFSLLVFFLFFLFFFSFLRVLSVFYYCAFSFFDIFFVFIFGIFLSLFFDASFSTPENAFSLISFFQEKLEAQKSWKGKSLWSLIDQVLLKKKIILYIALIFLFIFLAGNLYFIFKLFPKIEPFSFQFFLLAFIVFSGLGYFLFDFLYRPKRILKLTSHKKIKKVKRILENLSIRVGEKAPEVEVWATRNINAFSLIQKKKPTIFLSAGLLNTLNEKEIEGVLATQLVKIFSGAVSQYRDLNLVFSFSKALSLSFFLLVLYWIFSQSVIWWYFFVLLLILLFYPLSLFQKKEFLPESAFSLLNPIFLGINFLNFCLYYLFGWEETILCDLEAVQIMRDPRPLLSAFLTIKEKGRPLNNIPAQFFYLYFVKETLPFSFPLPQPSLSERKEIIESVWGKVSIKRKEEKLFCPNCKEKMRKIEETTKQGGKIEINICPLCQILWFEDYFNLLGALHYPEPVLPLLKKKEKEIKEIFCPKCGISLKNFKDPYLPKEIKIYTCPGCKGVMIDSESFKKYINYLSKKD